MSATSQVLPCSRTERFAKPASTTWLDADGYVVFDTAACRESSFNHRLELPHPPTRETLGGWFDRWEAHHGDKGISGSRYLTFEVTAPWAPFELPEEVTFDPLTCLRLERPMPTRGLPPGYRVAPLETDDDWRALSRLNEHIGEATEAEHLAYLRWYEAGSRDRVRAGQGVWMGAREGRSLVGSAGLLWNDREARFQFVQTHPDHRGRGVCSALLYALVETLDAQSETQRPVYIAATTGSAIERLYLGLNFEPCSWFYTLGKEILEPEPAQV